MLLSRSAVEAKLHTAGITLADEDLDAIMANGPIPEEGVDVLINRIRPSSLDPSG